MAHGEPVPKFVRGYTTALMVLGILFVFGVFVHQWMIGQEPEAADLFRFVRNIEVVLVILCLGTAVLRAWAARIAPTATAATSIVLAFVFPFGTAVFLYWLLSVRQRERVEPTDAATFD